MKVQQIARLGLGIGSAIASLLVLMFLVAAFLNSAVVRSVTVTFDGEEEPRDATLKPGGDEAIPDYRIDLVARGDRFELGVQPNTSAKDGITFMVADSVPRRAVQEIILIDDDPVNNDVLARVQGQGESLAANDYRFNLTVERSFDGGLIWFFETPVGQAVLWGIGIGVLVIVLSLLAPIFG